MLCYNGAVRRIPTQMCKTQQCAERNNGKKVFLQENGGKENFVGFLKSVEYNNPGRQVQTGLCLGEGLILHHLVSDFGSSRSVWYFFYR